MTEKRIYEFVLEAVSPVAVGSRDSGAILKDASGNPFIPGTSIGGALRDYLNRSGESKQTVFQYLGGTEPSENASPDVRPQQTFIESRIYISDGDIVSKDGQGQIQIGNKQGTAIDPQYRSALNKHFYTIEYLEPGFLVTFRIESDIEVADEESAKPDELERLIKVWALGIQGGSIRLGGHRNNGFGRFRVKSVGLRTYSFTDLAAIDAYIFNRYTHPSPPNPVKFDSDLNRTSSGQHVISIDIQGKFPYGVYQSFDDKETSGRNKGVAVTGPLKNVDGQGWYIPSSSMKGLLRSEFRHLLLRMLVTQNRENPEEAVEYICAQLFGSTDQRGMLVVSDMKLDAAYAEEVVIKRPAKEEEKSVTLPIYVKIDRLTGSVMGSALKHQNEIHGNASWHLELWVNEVAGEEHPYIFPFVYMLRRIGSGKVPIGGRSSIGLGQFAATRIEISGGYWKKDHLQSEPLHQDDVEWLQRSYSAFEQWLCSQYKVFKGGATLDEQ
ncbi:RAMP superfamily CRISPR-associated protein [Cohnella hongkongensis]|uniref:RAMP superfamily CRISPR-associated protein n=1 Tax=Cohnella hongkongensis TaxID=178337 RepID=A0ABV9FJR0_9BACL